MSKLTASEASTLLSLMKKATAPTPVAAKKRRGTKKATKATKPKTGKARKGAKKGGRRAKKSSK